METEEWRPVVDWPEYEVSSLGRVRRVAAGQGAVVGAVLKPSVNGPGYYQVNLCRQSRPRAYRIHVLVARAFLPPRPAGRIEIAHNDGDPLNNRADNLRWATPKENAADRVLHGTHHAGEACANAKLTEADVRRIRIAARGAPQARVAAVIARTVYRTGVVRRPRHDRQRYSPQQNLEARSMSADVKADIAAEAVRIVTGARRSAYGHPEKNFERIARLQAAYMASRAEPEAEIRPIDVAFLNLMQKVARICESPTHRDSFTDAVGYVLCAAEVAGVAVSEPSHD